VNKEERVLNSRRRETMGFTFWRREKSLLLYFEKEKFSDSFLRGAREKEEAAIR